MKTIIAAVFYLLLSPAFSHAQPSISFELLNYDHGLVNQGDKLDHIFEFQNKGDQDLVIEKVSSS